LTEQQKTNGKTIIKHTACRHGLPAPVLDEFKAAQQYPLSFAAGIDRANRLRRPTTICKLLQNFYTNDRLSAFLPIKLA
jgi:hypothetical protein